MKRLVLLPVLFTFFGCSTTEYVGDTHAPTEHVDTYFNTNSIKRPYETMGTAKTSAGHFISFEQLQKQLEKDAKAKGADAVLIESMDTLGFISSIPTSKPENLQGDDPSDSDGIEGNSSASNRERSQESVITAKLLKYTD